MKYTYTYYVTEVLSHARGIRAATASTATAVPLLPGLATNLLLDLM